MIDYLSMGSRDRPLLLMLHGVGGSAECFTPQLQAFSDDFHAVAWNMPGYGASPPLPSLSFAAIAAATNELLEELGAPAAHIVGHSIGGMIAQQFVADYPGRTTSLTLVATSAAFGSRNGGFQKRFIADRLGPLDRGATMQDLAASIIDGLTGEDPDPEMIQLACRSMAGVAEVTYRANIELLVTFDLRQKLGDISIPTLLIAGGRDTNAPPAVMAKMGSFIPGSQYRCVPNAGHLVNLEQPDAFNILLRNFLQSVASHTTGHQ